MRLQQVLFRGGGAAMVAVVLVAGACGGGAGAIRGPRPLVVFSGARIQPDSARLDSIDLWVEEVGNVIERDPSFLVITETVPRPAYPWETLEVRIEADDTVRVAIEAGSDARLSYQIYGFLHLMRRVDRIGEWFPEAADLDGYDLERFILARTADSWLLGRSVYDTQPYPPLEELVYAQDRGYLDAMILVARPDEFPEAREAWLAENPDGPDGFRTWFRETFDREPPGPSGS